MASPEESLSALVDDDPDPARAGLFQALQDDAGLRDTWSRYHLIGEVLRQGDARAAVGKLETRVAHALASEPVLLAPREKRQPVAPMQPAPRRVPRLAVAAAVAGLALGGVLTASLTRPPAGTAEFAVAAGPAAADGAQAVEWNAAGEPGAADPADLKRRMNEYLVRFSQQRAGLSVPNVHPYVRIVGFEQEGGR